MVTIEADEHLGPLLDRVEAGEEIVITRDGEPLARLLRWAEHPTADDSFDEAFREARKGARLDGLSFEALIEEGRE